MATRRGHISKGTQATTRIRRTKKPATFWKFEVAGQILEVLTPTEELTVSELLRRISFKYLDRSPSTSDIYETLDWMEEEGYIKTVGAQ